MPAAAAGRARPPKHHVSERAAAPEVKPQARSAPRAGRSRASTERSVERMTRTTTRVIICKVAR